DVVRVQRASHSSGGGLDRRRRGGVVAVRRRLRGKLGEYFGAAFGAHLDEEPVLAVEQLREREVVARLDLRPGPHRGAEARAAGLEAIDGDDERSGPSRVVVAIGMEPA